MNDKDLQRGFEVLRDLLWGQDDLFYAWQSKIRPFPINTSPSPEQVLTHEEIQAIIDEVSTVVGFKLNVCICLFPIKEDGKIKIVDIYGKRRYNCTANYKEHAIYLPIWGRQLYVVLHEVCHLICGPHEGHGSEFCELLFELCEYFGIAKAGDLTESATSYGLSVDIGEAGERCLPDWDSKYVG